MNKIIGVYKIVNTVTGDFYIGSSIDIKKRWKDHKVPSTRKNRPNMLLYKAMQEYGLECFSFEILEEVEPERLRQEEQRLIDMLSPTYNDRNSKGWNVERRKNSSIKSNKKYRQSDKGREVHRKASNKYYSRLCSYNGETLTLGALIKRFRKDGIPHSTQEAKKYLV